MKTGFFLCSAEAEEPWLMLKLSNKLADYGVSNKTKKIIRAELFKE